MTDIIKELAATKAAIDSATKRKAELERQLLEQFDNQIKDQLGDKDYGCGTATLEIGGAKVKVVVSKKVKWDSDRLAEIANQIAAAGQDPAMYVKTKHDVSETVYKSWPDAVKETFASAREVTPSKPAITIEG